MLVLRNVVNGSEQVLTVGADGARVIRVEQPKEGLSEAEQEVRRCLSERELLRIVSEIGVLGLRTG